MKKCKNCNVWPLEIIKRTFLYNRFVFTYKFKCPVCEKSVLEFKEKEKTLEIWNKIN